MAKLLSQGDYDSQRVDLERAISYAEAEYHSASYKAQTGAGDAAGAKAAKDHLDALRASLEGLHAAWLGSEQARADGLVAAREKAFASITADVDAMLNERADKLNAIVEAAETLADLSREAGQTERLSIRDQAQAKYREIARIKGMQRVTAGANGVAIDFGTAADVQADTQAMGSEDVNRIYQKGNQAMRGHDISASNFMAEANAARSAGKGALIKGMFDMGSTVLGGAQQYEKMRTARR